MPLIDKGVGNFLQTRPRLTVTVSTQERAHPEEQPNHLFDLLQSATIYCHPAMRRNSVIFDGCNVGDFVFGERSERIPQCAHKLPVDEQGCQPVPATTPVNSKLCRLQDGSSPGRARVRGSLS